MKADAEVQIPDHIRDHLLQTGDVAIKHAFHHGAWWIVAYRVVGGHWQNKWQHRLLCWIDGDDEPESDLVCDD
jgi:hypothetical protein